MVQQQPLKPRSLSGRLPPDLIQHWLHHQHCLGSAKLQHTHWLLTGFLLSVQMSSNSSYQVELGLVNIHGSKFIVSPVFCPKPFISTCVTGLNHRSTHISAKSYTNINTSTSLTLHLCWVRQAQDVSEKHPKLLRIERLERYYCSSLT